MTAQNEIEQKLHKTIRSIYKWGEGRGKSGWIIKTGAQPREGGGEFNRNDRGQKEIKRERERERERERKKGRRKGKLILFPFKLGQKKKFISNTLFFLKIKLNTNIDIKKSE